MQHSIDSLKRFKRAIHAYEKTHSNLSGFRLELNGSIPELPAKFLVDIYWTYLQRLQNEHEHSFLLDDTDTSVDSTDIQLTIAAEIEIVEDLINQIQMPDGI